MNHKHVVTLISTGQAQAGRVFIHRGAGSKCEGCEYSQVCVDNVEPERVYKIVKVRDKTLPCRGYETEMQVVEVVDAEIPVSIPAKKAISGAVIVFQTPNCEEETCMNYELCFPTGLKAEDRCKVLEVTGNLQCSQGSPRKKVLLQRVPVP
ncbi:MAG: UPF0179 family protein [Candidatus Bathyarchaeota archaeon]|nr:UPF0179 family protein [Candidatus Bathyarchaeota archaeon]